MLPDNSVRSFIIQNQTLGSLLELGGRCKLSTIGAAVQHERGVSGSLSPSSPEEGNDADGRNLTAVIQRQFNGYRAEEVVKEHTVADVSPSRLEERMNMLHLGGHRQR